MHVTTASLWFRGLLSSSGHRHLPPPAPLHVTEDPHPARETQEAGLLHAHDWKVRPQTLCQHPETRPTHQKCLLAPWPHTEKILCPKMFSIQILLITNRYERYVHSNTDVYFYWLSKHLNSLRRNLKLNQKFISKNILSIRSLGLIKRIKLKIKWMKNL